MEQSPSWETNSSSASRAIPCILVNVKVHYHAHIVIYSCEILFEWSAASELRALCCLVCHHSSKYKASYCLIDIQVTYHYFSHQLWWIEIEQASETVLDSDLMHLLAWEDCSAFLLLFLLWKFHYYVIIFASVEGCLILLV